MDHEILQVPSVPLATLFRVRNWKKTTQEILARHEFRLPMMAQ